MEDCGLFATPRVKPARLPLCRTASDCGACEAGYSKRHPEEAFSLWAHVSESEIDHIVIAITSNRTFCDGRHIEAALVVMGITCTYHCEGSWTALSCLL
jgi:hypothetical protein